MQQHPVPARGAWAYRPPSLGQIPASVAAPVSPLEWRTVSFLTNAAASVVGFMVAPRLVHTEKVGERTVSDPSLKKSPWMWLAYLVAGAAAVRALMEYGRVR